MPGWPAPWKVLAVTGVGIFYVRDTLLETRRLGQAQMRAYIGIKTKVIDDRATKVITFKMSFWNTGQTPAHHLQITCTWAGGEKAFIDDLQREFAHDGTGSRGTLGAGQRVRMKFSTNDPDLHTLSEEDYDRVLLEDLQLWVFGRIDYIDVFGERHWNYFRYQLLMLNGRANLMHAPSGNKSDDSAKYRAG